MPAPVRFVVAPVGFVIDPVRFVIGPVHFAIGPVHFVVGPVHFAIGPVHFVVGPVQFVIGPVHFVIGPVHFVVGPAARESAPMPYVVPAHLPARGTLPMADFFSLSTADLLQRAATLFTALRDSPDLLDALAPFQVEADDEVARGLALLEETRAAIGTQTAEAGEAVRATTAATQALATLEARYRRDRKLCRARHRPGSDGARVLGLVGEVPNADAALIAQADAFYRALQTSPDLFDGVRGISRQTVTDGLARVDAARTAEAAQARESGEAQQATATRRSAEARLCALADDVADVSEIALDDRPQARERLGLAEA